MSIDLSYLPFTPLKYYNSSDLRKRCNLIIESYSTLNISGDESAQIFESRYLSLASENYIQKIFVGNNFAKKDEVIKLLKETIMPFETFCIFGDMMVNGAEQEGMFHMENTSKGTYLGIAQTGKIHHWK